jgi:hypothetical protein
MNNNKENSQALITAIKKLAENPEALENFANYLNHHFDVWFEKYVNTAEGLVSEFKEFSEIQF